MRSTGSRRPSHRHRGDASRYRRGRLWKFAWPMMSELLIAGAGLNGMLLGVACAGAGLPVVIVDPQDPEAMLDRGFDGRTSAIAYGSRLVFDALGLWPDIAAGRRADPRNPYRRRQLAAVPALRLPRADPRPRRRNAARLYRREPRPAPRAARPRPRPAEPYPDRRTPRRRDARDRNRRRYRARRRHAPARPARRRRRRQPVAAAPYRRNPRDRMALPADRHRHDRRARAAACRHCRRAFSARRPVRDPADDRRAGPTRQIPARAFLDRVDRTRRSRAAPAGAARKPASPPNCAPASAGFSAGSSRSGRAGPIRWR